VVKTMGHASFSALAGEVVDGISSDMDESVTCIQTYKCVMSHSHKNRAQQAVLS
jgi:hypothetical protein